MILVSKKTMSCDYPAETPLICQVTTLPKRTWDKHHYSIVARYPTEQHLSTFFCTMTKARLLALFEKLKRRGDFDRWPFPSGKNTLREMGQEAGYRTLPEASVALVATELVVQTRRCEGRPHPNDMGRYQFRSEANTRRRSMFWYATHAYAFCSLVRDLDIKIASA
jgi:hypothetical protein